MLGGQLPESLNMEAALQAPEVLARFLRFIVALENKFVSPRFVTVTSPNTISLVTVARSFYWFRIKAGSCRRGWRGG